MSISKHLPPITFSNKYTSWMAKWTQLTCGRKYFINWTAFEKKNHSTDPFVWRPIDGRHTTLCGAGLLGATHPTTLAPPIKTRPHSRGVAPKPKALHLRCVALRA